jgi:hypothetical protein
MTLSKTPEYMAWINMMRRCYKLDYFCYDRYGGRGIKVCPEWHNPMAFVIDVGKRPTPQHSVGRVDNDKGYEPDNCRWETRTQQMRNRRTSKLNMVEAREIRMLVQRGYARCEVAAEFGISQSMVSRIVRVNRWKEDEP